MSSPYDCDYCGGFRCWDSTGKPTCMEYEAHRIKNLPNTLKNNKKDLLYYTKQNDVLKQDLKVVKSKLSKEYIKETIAIHNQYIENYEFKIKETELEMRKRHIK